MRRSRSTPVAETDDACVEPTARSKRAHTSCSDGWMLSSEDLGRDSLDCSVRLIFVPRDSI